MTAVNSEAVSGVHSFLLYGEETAFNTAVTANTHFGLVKNFSPKTNNSNVYLRGMRGTTTGGRNVVGFVGGKAEHSISVEFDVINWFFMEQVLGTATGSDPYTYSESDNTKSITLVRAIDNPGPTTPVDRDETWAGSVVNSVTIKAAVGEPISATAEILSASHFIDTTIHSAVALPTVDPYSFAEASIALPSGSTLTNIIDSLEITITNNYEMLWGLGSRKAKNAVAKARDYKIKFSVKYLDNNLLTKLLGLAIPLDATEPTENATLICTFTNGGKSATFTFTKFVLDDLSGKETLNETIGEEFSGTAYSLAVVEDNT
jgi:hypothetical protein